MKNIRILHRQNNSVLYEYECENNTIKKTLEKAAESGTNLSYANLSYANLSYANLSYANLSDANLSGTNLSGTNLSYANLSYANLSYANLSDANLSGTNLSGTNLSDANLSGANLSGTNLSGTNLSYANLSYANLSDANLSGTNLSDANLSGTNLSGTNLSDANLSGANLSGTNLSDANLSGANIQYLKSHRQIIPESGSFIAWKKASGYVLKLQIPSKMKRTCNIKSRKCRCEGVKTLQIQNIDGTKSDQIKVSGDHDPKTIYEINKITLPDSYDNNFFEDCTNGIHFFISRDEAVKY